MNGFKTILFVVFLMPGFVLPELLHADSRVALIVQHAGNVRINGYPVSDNQWVLNFNDIIKIDGKEAYLAVIPVYLPNQVQGRNPDAGIIKLDENHADEKTGKKAGEALDLGGPNLPEAAHSKNDRWPQNLVSVLAAKGKSGSVLIARRFGNTGLRPIFPMQLDDFYGLSGNRLCFCWGTSLSHDPDKKYTVSIVFPNGRKLARTVSKPDTCFSIDRQSCSFLNWRVQGTSSNLSLEGKCYLGDRRDLFLDIEQAECMIPFENSVSAILARADCLLENELEYEAYMTLRNASVNFPDVMLFPKLVNQMEKSRQ
jgi:hypothetical protein